MCNADKSIYILPGHCEDFWNQYCSGLRGCTLCREFSDGTSRRLRPREAHFGVEELRL
ncbi:unnamed protein product [Musa hybrid cultivar]